MTFSSIRSLFVRASDLDRTSLCLAHLLFALVSAAVFAAAIEWGHYRRVVAWESVPLVSMDLAGLFWILAVKTYLVLLPVLAIGALLVLLGVKRAGHGAFMAGWVLVFFWLTADLWVQRFSGGHALSYVGFVSDAVSVTGGGTHAAWAGDVGQLTKLVLILFVGVLAGGLLGMQACLWIARKLASGRLGRPAVLWPGYAILLIAPLLGLLPAYGMFNDPVLFQPLHAAMPVEMSAAERPSVRLWNSLRGRANGPASPVHIVSVFPNPRGADSGKERIVLRNATKATQSLKGWRLQNLAGRTFPLKGSIAARAERTIALPTEKIALDNRGDTVWLLDPSGQIRDRISYVADEAAPGMLVASVPPLDRDACLRRINGAIAPLYAEWFERITSAKPVEAVPAVVEGNAKPNVIVLVLESFRHSALSPEQMPRLDAWSRNGLRLNRHYANTNISNFGMFALLYGRSPLVYDATLDAAVPPQLPASFKQAGYRTTFITSGDCSGFRRMGEYLNERTFDRAIVKTPTERAEHTEWMEYRSWPDRDREIFSDIRALMTGEPQKPPELVVAFLMSTHFPYAFPEAFAAHQPAGDAAAYSAWNDVDVAALRNRYRNSLLFMDDEIARLIEALDPSRNIVIVTGDHGESLMEDGTFVHGTRTSEVQVRVPLVMVGPGVPPRAIETYTDHLDVLPTLLHATLGTPAPLQHAHARSLLLPDAPTKAQTHIVPHRWRQPHHFVLFRNGKRLQFEIRTDRPEARAVGFLNDSGTYDLNTREPAAAAEQWIEAFREELEGIR